LSILESGGIITDEAGNRQLAGEDWRRDAAITACGTTLAKCRAKKGEREALAAARQDWRRDAAITACGGDAAATLRGGLEQAEGIEAVDRGVKVVNVGETPTSI